MDLTRGRRLQPANNERINKMHKTQNFEKIGESLLIDTPTLKNYLSSGRETALKIGTAAGARVQVGKRVLWNRNKITNYLQNLTE